VLRQLLQLIEQSNGQLNLAELGQRLGADPSAVAGMLETLLRKGHIREVGTGCGSDGSSAFCDSCSLNRHCSPPAARARRYQIVN
jgi:predicted transcriptional regulator